jgi:drug/metabolite transporter (DMT)-like permease
MLRGTIYGLSAAAIWGGMYVVSDVVLQTIPPFMLLSIRLVMGAAILGVVLWRMPDVHLPSGRGWLHPLALAAVTWGLFSVLVRQVSAKYPTLIVTLVGFLGGLIFVIPAAAVEARYRPIGVITPGIVLGLLYLGIISTALSMWLWNRAFSLVDASLAGLFFFAQPLVGAVLSVIFLHQQMTADLWIGGAFIGLGLLLSLLSPQWFRSPWQPAPEQET